MSIPTTTPNRKPSAKPIPLDPNSQHYRELIAMGCVPPGTELAIDDSSAPIASAPPVKPGPYVPLPEMLEEDRPAYLSDLRERDAAIVQLAEELAALKRRAS